MRELTCEIRLAAVSLLYVQLEVKIDLIGGLRFTFDHTLVFILQSKCARWWIFTNYAHRYCLGHHHALVVVSSVGLGGLCLYNFEYVSKTAIPLRITPITGTMPLLNAKFNIVNNWTFSMVIGYAGTNILKRMKKTIAD